jgi:hypothetical protein
MDVVDFAQKCQSGKRLDTSQTAQCFDLSPVRVRVCEAFEFSIEGSALRIDILEVLELGGQSSPQRPLEFEPEFGEPLPMCLCPIGLALAVDKTVVAQHAADTKLGRFAVDLIGVSQPQESAKGLLVFGGDVDRGEVTATVKPGQHDGVEAVSFTPVTGFTRDERRGDYLAVEAVTGEHPLENEPRAGSFVTGPYRSLLGETPKQSSYLHQIARESDNFGFLVVAFENGSSD